jgi:hypothetical protein
MITYQGRKAWRIESAPIRVTILECGGHVAEIACKFSSNINPLWTQNRVTIDSDQFDPAIHGPIYGVDAEARLISGLLGHNLCFPYWGSPSAAESTAGMTFHGESNILRWEKLEGGPDWLHLGVTLPNCSIHFEREVRCAGNIVYFSEMAANLTAWDRPVGWCEHVTLGPPFLEAGKTVFEANLTRGFRTGENSETEFFWPQGYGTISCNLTEFSALPHSDLVNSFLVDPGGDLGYFVAWHPTYRLIFGYVFLRREFPWINVWEDHSSSRQTRGMEFSNTPIDGTMKQFCMKPDIRGVPAYDWLDAKGKLRKSYAAFAIGAPDHYAGVANVTIAGGKLNIEEKKTGSVLSLDWVPHSGTHGMAGL